MLITHQIKQTKDSINIIFCIPLSSAIIAKPTETSVANPPRTVSIKNITSNKTFIIDYYLSIIILLMQSYPKSDREKTYKPNQV